MSKPFVSIVIPCRNEEQTITQALDSILENDYPNDKIEIIVVDGMSQDKTRELITNYQKKYSFIQRLDNPQKGQNTALNIGIRNARGDLILRMDAHSSLSNNYISQCIKYMDEYGADVVGGRITTSPRDQTAMGYAIASVMSERFGVGRSEFRIADENHTKPKWVDTVPFACYKRSVFDKVGYFHPRLNRSEDIEFHIRVRQSGLKILFAPKIMSNYYARSEFKPFWLHAVDNGYWALLPTLYTNTLVISLRHLVPMLFVSFLLLSSFLSITNPALIVCPLSVFISHTLFSLAVAIKTSIQRKKPRLIFLMPLLFFLLHLGYGLGSYKAVFKIFSVKIQNLFLEEKEAPKS